MYTTVSAKHGPLLPHITQYNRLNLTPFQNRISHDGFIFLIQYQRLLILIKDLTLHNGNLQTFFSFEPTATVHILTSICIRRWAKETSVNSHWKYRGREVIIQLFKSTYDWWFKRRPMWRGWRWGSFNIILITQCKSFLQFFFYLL